ncbi:GNAT family N-acetyltransferase [Enterococcus thailandicus]|nr:GNAT family N-acetyltransferase [Enterococcus thailandicus]MDK4352385.1 GNAT family N-acetyltransferase [Enterococcus thailandicus]MDT2735206.1 GNAT family N-acetyltransferase [Enterococcus thailandicus]MEA4829346.1 GNAT family N-acetyltransferase [Enterococcus thailandicus]
MAILETSFNDYLKGMKKMDIQKIEYDSEKYQQTLNLRNKVMRVPLGLTIEEEDFSHEAEQYILGAFDDEFLLGVGVLSQKLDESKMKVEYLCVDSQRQSAGVGKQLLSHLELYAKKEHAKTIELEARVSAQSFYEKMGYVAYGDTYLMAIAPVEHIRMKKFL